MTLTEYLKVITFSEIVNLILLGTTKKLSLMHMCARRGFNKDNRYMFQSSLIAMFESTTSILQMHQPDITSKLGEWK